MRFIDADAFEVISYQDTETFSDSFDNGVLYMLEKIDNAPTVDAVPVVRCKDCKWCYSGYCEKFDDLIPYGCAHREWEDWFCADGERRET